MESPKLVPCLLAIFLVVQPSIHSTYAIKISPASNLIVQQNHPFELECVADLRIDYCKWTHMSSGASCLIIVEEDMKNDTCFPKLVDDTSVESSRQRFYRFYKNESTCMLRVSEAKQVDFSQWQCAVYSSSSVEQKAFAQVNVTILSPTKLKFKTKPNRRVFAGKEEHIECSGQGGYPTPKLLASIGPNSEDSNEDINLDPIENGHYEDGGEIVHTNLFRYIPLPEHHNFFVKCMSLQTYNENGLVKDAYPLQTQSQPFEVFYPAFTQINKSQFEVEIGLDGYVTFPIEANPKPGNEGIIWHMVGESESIRLPAGQTMGKLTAESPDFRGNQIFATLKIQKISYEDLRAHGYLEVENEAGVARFDFSLREKSLLPHEDENNGNLDLEDSGSNVGLIIGICFAIAVLAIGAGIGIWYCKANQIACFLTNSGTYLVKRELSENPTYNQSVGLMRDLQNIPQAKSDTYKDECELYGIAEGRASWKSPEEVLGLEASVNHNENSNVAGKSKWPED